jgi:hypothetical protein
MNLDFPKNENYKILDFIFIESVNLKKDGQEHF